MGKIVYNTVCERGLVRENNQDSVFADVKGRNGIFCVADGMGGYEKGEVASGIIVQKVEEAWKSFFETENKKNFRDLFNAVSTAIKTANRDIYENYNKDAVCGSTVVVLLIFGNDYGVLSAGDSRLYSYQKDTVKQVTEDDVWENLPEQKGKDIRELRSSSKYGKLTNAVGTMRDVRINYQMGKIKGSATYLLCSDGLYKMCSAQELARNLTEHWKDPAILNEILQEKVYMAGAKDNLSIITVNVSSMGLFSGKDETARCDSPADEATDRIDGKTVAIEEENNDSSFGSKSILSKVVIGAVAVLGILIITEAVLLIGNYLKKDKGNITDTEPTGIESAITQDDKNGTGIDPGTDESSGENIIDSATDKNQDANAQNEKDPDTESNTDVDTDSDKKNGDDDMEITELSELEKKLFSEMYPNEDQINEGKLLGYQKDQLEYLRTGIAYVEGKYSAYKDDMTYTSFNSAKKTTIWANIICRYKEDKDFIVWIKKEDGEFICKDTFYGIIYGEEYDKKIEEALKAKGYTAVSVTEFSNGIGNELSGDASLEEFMDKFPELTRKTMIYVQGDANEELNRKVEDIIRKLDLYGSYSVYTVPAIDGQTVEELKAQSTDAYIFNTFNN
ncbi:MAG: serine/threonine-protein phosphatase [Lachnospiraceae bacterium]|nr:serine/threonine-protein phosphatase [Lachnospiraceae bacterium]